MAVEAADPSVWKQFAQWAVMPLGALFAAVWGLLNHRIGQVEKKVDAGVSRSEFEHVEKMAESGLTRTEFDQALSDSRQERLNIRLDIKELHVRIDASKDVSRDHIDAVYDRLSDKMDKLRDDMNGGFTRVLQERQND